MQPTETNDEMLELALKWLDLKYSLRKFERNWEPKSKKIFNHLYAEYKDINNIYLSNDDIKWLNLNKSILRKYIFKLEKKLNCVSFYDRINSLNKPHYLNDLNHMNSMKKNKWQSQQIKKKNSYKTYANNSKKYKHSKKQIMYKMKTKPNLKKKKRYSITKHNISNDDITYISNIIPYKTNNITIHEKAGSNYHIFVNKLSYLLTYKIDSLLNKQICINKGDGQIMGKLTCISQGGQYKLEQVLHNNKQTIKYSYWFHINMTNTVHIIDDNNNENYASDITHLFMDIMRLKIIQYFIFICSYKLDKNKTRTPEQSSLKYLFLKNILNCDANILHLTHKNIKKCKFVKKMLGQFCDNTKNNNFDYFEYRIPARFYLKKPKQLTTKQLTTKQLLSILCSYICLCKDYIKTSNHLNDSNEPKQVKNDYILWDTMQVKRLAKKFTHNEHIIK